MHNDTPVAIMKWLFKPDLVVDINIQPRRLPVTFLLALLFGSDFLYIAWFVMVIMLVMAFVEKNTDFWFAFLFVAYCTFLFTRFKYKRARLLLHGRRVDGFPTGSGTYSNARPFKWTPISKKVLFTRIVQVIFTDHLGVEHQVSATIWTPLVEWDERPAAVFYDNICPSDALVIFHNARRDLLWQDDDGLIHLNSMPIALLPAALFVMIGIIGMLRWLIILW